MDIRQRMMQRWFALWRRLGKKSPEDDLWILYHFYQLLERYEESHRAYHTLGHIEYMCDRLVLHRALARRYDAVEFAIWFHDVVLHTHRRPNGAPPNEALSAAYARYVMTCAGLPAEFQEYVADRLIMATLHLPDGAATDDEKLIADIDLCGLGWAWPAFRRNGDRIRFEYAQYTDAEFRAGRSKILQWFLDRERIFYLRPFRDKYEARARENLKREIARLSGTA